MLVFCCKGVASPLYDLTNVGSNLSVGLQQMLVWSGRVSLVDNVVNHAWEIRILVILQQH